jgi:hypothetical protein
MAAAPSGMGTRSCVRDWRSVLSHLHHRLQPADLNTLGHIDIVMVAVDGEWTMSQEDAAAVVEQLQPRIA